MPSDAIDLERAYAAHLIAWLRSETKYGPGWDRGTFSVVDWRWEGVAPDSELRIIFRVRTRPCLFGAIDKPWAEDGGALTLYPDDPASGAAGSTSMRWLEMVHTDDFPRECKPDAEGITWFPLWDED